MWANRGVIREKIGKLALKLGFEAVLDFKLIWLTKYAPWTLLKMNYPIKWPNWYHQGSFWMIKKPLVGLLMEPFHQSRLITAKITYFSNEIQLSLNHIWSELFEIIGVNKQMFISFGQDEPHRSPKEAYFNCVIGIYFLSFFYEHPVDESKYISI